MHVVVQAVTNYLPSRAASLLKRDGERAFRRHVIRTSLQAALLAVLFILAMQVAALPVLHVLYRGHYDSAEPLLRALAICMLPSLLGAVVGSYSLAMHDSRSTFFANFGSAVFTFTGGLWLINAFGAIGAMTAVSLSLTVATLLQSGFLMIGIGRLSDGSIKAAGPDALGDL
jgi:O-antigen/teichoic acid export membrane protein